MEFNRNFEDAFGQSISFTKGTKLSADESFLFKKLNNMEYFIGYIIGTNSKDMNAVQSIMLAYALKHEPRMIIHENPVATLFVIPKVKNTYNLDFFKSNIGKIKTYNNN